MKVYAAIANALHIRDTDSDMRQEWRDSAKQRLNHIADNYLPRGSGFDVAPTLDHDGAPRSAFSISGSFHKMDEHGCYEGWVDFEIKVFAKEDLVFPWDTKISCLDEDLGKYILETYLEALNQDWP